MLLPTYSIHSSLTATGASWPLEFRTGYPQVQQILETTLPARGYDRVSIL